MKIHIPVLLLIFFFFSGCKPGNKDPKPEKKQTGSTTQKQPKEAREKELAEAREKELAEARLDEQKQTLIFDLEHVTFVIEQVFGEQWKKAFKTGDVQKFNSFFYDEFVGNSIEPSAFVEKSVAVLTEKTRISNVNSRSEAALDGGKMASYLASMRNRFSKLDRVKFRVLKITQLLSKQPIWECRILVDAVGETDGKQPAQYESEQTVIFEIPNESEIATHPAISEWRIEKETFRAAKHYLTTEVTEETLINEVALVNNWKLDIKHTEQYWFQYSVEDFNRDGKLDFAVACNYRYPRLFYHATGNRFFEVADERNVVATAGKTRIGKSFGCAWIDYDNDGYPDLVMGPRLFKNNQGKSFTDVTKNSGLIFHRECMGVLVADYDCDGLLDIYAMYQSPPVETDQSKPKQWVNETLTGMENHLWKNMGGGKFKDVTRRSNAGGGKRHSHAANWFFYDDDHYPDLYIANDFGKNVLLRNRGDGTFEDLSAESGTAGYSTSMGVSTGDLDNDGRSEIYVANMYSKMGRRIIGQVSDQDYPDGIYEQIKGSCAGNRLYTRNAAKEFKEIGEDVGVHDVGWAFGPALFDLDGNGLLDIYATTGFMSFDRQKPDG